MSALTGAVALGLLVLGLVFLVRGEEFRAAAVLTVTNVLYVAHFVLARNVFWAAWSAVATVMTAIWLGSCWRRRRKRRRAAALLGAKSRAVRDALVRRAREAAVPRPVLRPVPQGPS